jgi:uncharacterized protein YggE
MKATCGTRFSLGLALVVGVAGAACAAQMPGQGITVSKENRTIAITATDSVTATADVATVHIGYVVYAVDQDTAYAAGSKVSNAVIGALKAAGVPADAIQSQDQSVAPVQPFQLTNLTDTEKAQRKFVATQSWAVRTNAADAARTLDLAVKAGANNSGQIDWSLKDENTPQTQAAGKALQRAREVAQAMASGLGVKLGVLIFASNETQAAPVRPLMGGKLMAAQAAAPVAPLAINPQQIEKTATVYAVFAIE